jgi:hypothetical protein
VRFAKEYDELKVKKMINRCLMIVPAAIMLSACQSEVDKCVSSYMAAHDVQIKRQIKEVAEWEELQKKKDKEPLEELRLRYWNPSVSQETKEEAEARYRYACLTAAGKK